jgi:hypothetical protein
MAPDSSLADADASPAARRDRGVVPGGVAPGDRGGIRAAAVAAATIRTRN